MSLVPLDLNRPGISRIAQYGPVCCVVWGGRRVTGAFTRKRTILDRIKNLSDVPDKQGKRLVKDLSVIGHLFLSVDFEVVNVYTKNIYNKGDDKKETAKLFQNGSSQAVRVRAKITSQNWRSDLADPREHNHWNSKLFRGF